MDTKRGTYGIVIFTKSSQESPTYIRRSKWAAISESHIWTGCSTHEMNVGINYLIMGVDLLETSHHCLSLIFPFLLIAYRQWGLRKIELLGEYMGFPNIPR